MPHHIDVVRTVKAELEAKNVDLRGPCGAFEITKRVAWALKGEGFGLVKKIRPQNNCNGFGVDVLMKRDGQRVDILIDAEAPRPGGTDFNVPSWQFHDGSEPDRKLIKSELWMEPIDPGSEPVPKPTGPMNIRTSDDRFVTATQGSAPTTSATRAGR